MSGAQQNDVIVPAGLRDIMYRAARDAADRAVADGAQQHKFAEEARSEGLIENEGSGLLTRFGASHYEEKTLEHYPAFCEAIRFADLLIGNAPTPDLPGWWRECVKRKFSELRRVDREKEQDYQDYALIDQTINAELFKEAGQSLYGERWQSEMSRDMNISDRTVRRWIASKSDVPQGIAQGLLKMIQTKIYILTDLKNKITMGLS